MTNTIKFFSLSADQDKNALYTHGLVLQVKFSISSMEVNNMIFYRLILYVKVPNYWRISDKLIN